MRAFGGTIGCRSEVGKFTQFTLQFPAVSESEVAIHEQKIFERATPFFKGKRILVVDDDAGQRASDPSRVVEGGRGGERSRKRRRSALTMLRQSPP